MISKKNSPITGPILPFKRTQSEREKTILQKALFFVQADMSLEVVALALTSDKLAGGPLREHLEKTQEHLALRSLQFWEDAQRYLLPPENVSSYGKYHSAKTLIATYIAPDSPREMSMSPQVRADLIRLLPEERGDHLLSTVVKTCIEVTLRDKRRNPTIMILFCRTEIMNPLRNIDDTGKNRK